jgi:hypothetical protein
MQSKSVYKIPISTTPLNAVIQVTDKMGKEIILTQGQDTLTLKASSGYFRRAEYSIMVTAKDYEPKTETLYFVMDKKYLNNFYLFHIMPIGLLLIDPLSGSMWEPFQNEFKIELNPIIPLE